MQNNDNLEKERQKLGFDLRTGFNEVFKNLVEEKCSKDKILKMKIAEDLGITYQALINYTKDRIPEYKQLALIKNYFNVPYSFLFGETKVKSFNGDNFDLDLSEKAINNLKDLSLKAKNNDYLSGAIMYALESLLTIDNYNLLIILAYLTLGRMVDNKEKMTELYDFATYQLITKIGEYIKHSAKKLNIPNAILVPTYDILKEKIKNINN